MDAENGRLRDTRSRRSPRRTPRSGGRRRRPRGVDEKMSGKVVRTAVLEHVEGHDDVLERAVRLAHELVDLRMRREMDDERRPADTRSADATRERRVVTREILQQVAKVIRPRVQPLVDAEDLVALALKPQREVGADLAARPGDQDAHQAATGTACTPRSVVEVAASMRTSTSSPGRGRAREVDGRVPSRAPAKERTDRCGSCPRRAPPPLLRRASHSAQLRVLHDVDQPLDAARASPRPGSAPASRPPRSLPAASRRT